MDRGGYRPQASITRVDCGIEPTAKADECSSHLDDFGRPLLKSSEDDIMAVVPRKGSDRTAIDIIRDGQPTARPSTFVPRAFAWSTTTAGPKVSCHDCAHYAIWFVSYHASWCATQL